MHSEAPESVVLLHGLAGHRWMMNRLGQSIALSDFNVLNWGYRSITQSIERLAGAFADHLQSHQAATRLHIVAHSMGSIVARRALQLFRPPRLGRLVMLAPPNAGSEVAQRLSTRLGWFCPPLRELSSRSMSYVNQLGPLQHVETGIIAAELDRVVDLESTHLSGASDHIVLPSHHTALLWREDTVGQTLHFLRHGRFHSAP